MESICIVRKRSQSETSAPSDRPDVTWRNREFKEAIERENQLYSCKKVMGMTRDNWETVAAAKRQDILNAIPPKWRLPEPTPPPTEVRDVTGSYIQQFLTPREVEITETDAVGITQRTTSGKWTAVEVTEAFCHRAALAHQLVTCLHEIFFDAAIDEAKKLDAHFSKTKQPVGPLHGLPVSLKDQFHVKGVETTMGYVGWIGSFEGNGDDPRKFVTESELVRELRSLGAVLYCKTSVPVTLMAGETANHIIKYTWNPKNRHLSCGGSSGGEGALIALRGSPVGFGTDRGGSVRIPAAFNGLFGLRPSAGRVPYEGAATSMDGQNTILSVIGPLAPNVRSLKMIFQAVLTQMPWYYDPLVLEIPWRNEMEQQTRKLIQASVHDPSRLAFAVMRHDGIVRPHPPIARGLEIIEHVIRQLGHKIIEWNPPSHKVALKLSAKAYNMDGGHDLGKHIGLSGEAPIPQCIVEQGDQLPASEVAQLNVQKRAYQKSYLDYWQSTAALTETGRPVDGVFCPVAPHAAVVPEEYRHVGYSSFVNLLDYTSVVIPVTSVDKTVDTKKPATGFLSETDEQVYSDYDAEIYDGAPVGIQLVGRRLEEERILTLAEYISDGLQRA